MNELESGLRILARIIARVYLEELTKKTISNISLEEKEEETCQSKD